MKTFKRILFLVSISILSMPLIIYSGSSPSEPDNIGTILVSWAQLNPHLNLEYELHDVQYIPIAEPNEPMFENNDGEMDIYKVLTESYGSNNRGPSYYYYMHGGWSGWQCMDVGGQNSVDTDDASNNTAVVESVNLNQGQTIWAQIMSECHSNPNNSTSTNGRGFWYKWNKNLGPNDFALAQDTGIEMIFGYIDITTCTDHLDQDYGCGAGDAGNDPT